MRQLKDIYWLAGLIEGEGCFSLHTTRCKPAYKAHSKPKLEVGSTDRDVIIRAATILTGREHHYIRRSNHKSFYYAVLTSKPAIAWMMTLYPLMGERRKAKIKELITSWKLYSSREVRAFVA